MILRVSGIHDSDGQRYNVRCSDSKAPPDSAAPASWRSNVSPSDGTPEPAKRDYIRFDFTAEDGPSTVTVWTDETYLIRGAEYQTMFGSTAVLPGEFDFQFAVAT